MIPPSPARAALASAAAVATAIALSACGPGAPPRSAPHALADKPMPDFKRRAVDGASVDTASLRGKVVVVKFFAKYCEPCKRTLPAAKALAESRSDVVVIGVAEDESEADVRAMVAEYGLGFPVVHDQGNVVAGRYRVRELPVSFVVDPRGAIRWVGGADQAEGDLAAAAAAFR